MAALLTLERLRKQLGYDRVAEERRSDTLQDGSVCYDRFFTVRPEDRSLAYIYFVFDDEMTLLILQRHVLEERTKVRIDFCIVVNTLHAIYIDIVTLLHDLQTRAVMR